MFGRVSDSSSGTWGKKTGRHFSAAQKSEIVRRVQAGESKAKVGRENNIPESTLRGWCKAAQKRKAPENESSWCPNGNYAWSFSSEISSTSNPNDLSFDETKKRKLKDESGSPCPRFDYARDWLDLISGFQGGGAVYTQPGSPTPNPLNFQAYTPFGGFVLNSIKPNNSDWTPAAVTLPSWHYNVDFSPNISINMREITSSENSVYEESDVLDLSKDSDKNSKNEAMIQIGQNFLDWLANCGNPSITQLHIRRLQDIIERCQLAGSTKK